MSDARVGPAGDLHRYRDYLLLLARAQLPPRLQAKLDASDIVNQTLLEAHRDRDRLRGTTGLEVAAWLRQILAHNLANAARDLDRQKRDVGRERSLERMLEASSARLEACLSDGGLAPPEQAERNEQVLHLAVALMRLPESQRQVVELRYLQGWTLKAIAEHLEKSTSAVAGLLHRGMSQLRADLARAKPTE
jgi:RNA polymerase sigma-70 factor (ECF subfamily)